MTYSTVYKAKDGWRYRFTRGGRIVAVSSEAYSEKRKAADSLYNLCHSMATGKVRVKGDR